jgi:excisionase family DNA binding protein
MNDQHMIFTVSETSEILRVKMPTIRAWILQDRLPVLRLGRRVFIKRETVEKVLNEGLISVESH